MEIRRSKVRGATTSTKKQVEDKCAQNMKTAETAHQAEVKAMQDRLDEEAKQAKLLGKN